MSGTWLRNCWYQAGWTDEVTVEQPLVRTIIGEPVLFYREADGTLGALLDRCPHRFAPFSAGTIDSGRVTCGYHGLAFDRSGACVHNPHGPITSAMRAKSYVVGERHTAIWIWMGDPVSADIGAIPDLTFIDETPESGRIRMYMPTKANYQLLADNIMDLSHADFLHPTSLGGMMVSAKAKSGEEGDQIVASWIAKDCVPPPAFVQKIAPALRADVTIDVRWQAPGLMVLTSIAMPTGIIPTRKDQAITLHNMVPESETTTHYFMCSTRLEMIDNPEFSAFLEGALGHAFNHEDKPMLEKQQARMATSDLWALDPILLPVDAAAVRVRRKLTALITAEDQMSEQHRRRSASPALAEASE